MRVNDLAPDWCVFCPHAPEICALNEPKWRSNLCETEMLSWLAKGQTHRDSGDILGKSSRTAAAAIMGSLLREG